MLWIIYNSLENNKKVMNYQPYIKYMTDENYRYYIRCNYSTKYKLYMLIPVKQNSIRIINDYDLITKNIILKDIIEKNLVK